jgi:hypothetical protein
MTAESAFVEGKAEWKISGMTAKIQAFTDVNSTGHATIGPVGSAGVYHIGLRMGMHHTYPDHVGFYLLHKESGSCVVPIGVGGSVIEVFGKDGAVKKTTFPDAPKMKQTGLGLGYSQFITKASLLEDYVTAEDTITVKATIRLHVDWAREEAASTFHL